MLDDTFDFLSPSRSGFGAVVVLVLAGLFAVGRADPVGPTSRDQHIAAWLPSTCGKNISPSTRWMTEIATADRRAVREDA